MCAILENWHFQMTLKWTLGEEKAEFVFIFIDVNWRKWWNIFQPNARLKLIGENFTHFPQQWFDIHTHSHSEHIYNANDKLNHPVNISNYSPFKQLNSNVQGGYKIVHKCWQLWTLTQQL